MAPVRVDGLVVAKQGWDNAAMFELDGEQVVIRPTAGKRLGTIVAKDHPIARAHGHLFEPLVIQPDYDTEG
jgi:hypothetical protein